MIPPPAFWIFKQGDVIHKRQKAPAAEGGKEASKTAKPPAGNFVLPVDRTRYPF